MFPQPVKTHLPSVAQFIISLIGLVTSIIAVLLIWVMILAGGTVETLADASSRQMQLFAWFILVISLVSIPSLVYSIRRLARLTKESGQTYSLLMQSSVAFLFLILLVFLGYQFPEILTFPLAYVFLSGLAVAIPLWWFVELGRYKLNQGSAQRFWGLVNFQIFAGMPLIVFFEVLAIAVVVIFGGVWLFNQAEFKPLLMTLQTQLMIDPQHLSLFTDQINGIFQKPGVLAAGLMLIVILIPLVEEILKPLALWFFIKQEWSPSEGFSSGMVCGGAFALVESLTALVSVSQENWLPTLIARLGTGLLHILTSGLTGWALISAWRDKKYRRLGISYLLCIFLHGLWNFFAFLYGFSTIELQLVSFNPVLVEVSPWALGFISIGMLITLIIMNQRLHKTRIPPAIPPLPVETIG